MTRQEWLEQEEEKIPVHIRQAIGCATIRGEDTVAGAGAPFKLGGAYAVLSKRFDIHGQDLERAVDYLYCAINGQQRREQMQERMRTNQSPFDPPRRGFVNGWMK
jgi:hypothetical protein